MASAKFLLKKNSIVSTPSKRRRPFNITLWKTPEDFTHQWETYHYVEEFKTIKLTTLSACWNKFVAQVGRYRCHIVFAYSCGRAKNIRKRYRVDGNIFENGFLRSQTKRDTWGQGVKPEFNKQMEKVILTLAWSIHTRFRRKTHTFLSVLTFRPHVNDKELELFPSKTETFKDAFESGDF